MSFKRFLRDKLDFIIVNICFMAFIVAYLQIFNIPSLAVMFIVVAWLIVFFIYILLAYNKRKQYFQRIKELSRHYPFYQIAAVLERPPFAEAEPFYELLEEAGNKMETELSALARQKGDYQDYIETWVHEIKNPIAALKMIVELDGQDLQNHSQELFQELDKIENYVEQALYVARVENVEKDYLVREFPVMKAVKGALQKNRGLLRRNGVEIETVNSGVKVFSDEKWLDFIISQIIANAVQYGGKKIKIWAEEKPKYAALHIEDNGMGISSADLERVFEKGFTGETGRSNRKSTGLGLYLIHSLCQKLEHEITISSELGKYTRLTVLFPKSEFLGLK